MSERISKSEANYGTPAKGEGTCFDCGNLLGNLLGRGVCKRVVGAIELDKTCDEHTPKLDFTPKENYGQGGE